LDISRKGADENIIGIRTPDLQDKTVAAKVRLALSFSFVRLLPDKHQTRSAFEKPPERI